MLRKRSARDTAGGGFLRDGDAREELDEGYEGREGKSYKGSEKKTGAADRSTEWG